MNAPAATAVATHTEMANAIRFLSMDAVEKANSGHPGMPLGVADVVTVLFSRYLKIDSTAPRWQDRDRFVLSAGHGSMALYAAAYLLGYEDMDIDQIRNFRQLGYRTAGHPEVGLASIVDSTTGPLGQGLANAVGMALAERMQAARWGDDIVDHRTYAIVGDGCLMEGLAHEAISLAGHFKLGKLIVLWDDNRICIDGDTALTVTEDYLKRVEAAGWDAQRVDGHDPEAIAAAIEAAKASDKPSLIACRTVIGYGTPGKAGSEKCHGAPLGPDEVAGARARLGWSHAPFEVPDHILAAWRVAGRRNINQRKDWEARVEALPEKSRAEWERIMGGRLPDGWWKHMHEAKARFAKELPTIPTRKASQEILEMLTEAIPEMVGGSCDLSLSCLTWTKACQPSLQAGRFEGRFIHYGAREHCMGAIMNGLVLHKGIIPFGGTFLAFGNYLWPALRLSALMKQRVLFIFSHDSIGVGEDGPTHQPVEALATARAAPNVLVFRPCDAVETAEVYELALMNDHCPSVIALSRNPVPPIRRHAGIENLSAKGAYVMSPSKAGPHRVTLIGTGSEVQLAMEAQAILAKKRIGAQVVSMPCWGLFERQPKEYRSAILGEGTVRVAVEALSTFGWERYVGLDGAVIGMPGYGASAPYPKLYEHFGITAQAVADAALARL